MFDDEHGVARLDQALQGFEQSRHVLEVQPGGRLIQDIERIAGRRPLQLGCELDALGFAAAEGRRRLSQLQVAEANILQRHQTPRDLRQVAEEVGGLFDRHLKHVVHALVLEPDRERIGVKAGAVTFLANDFDGRKEVHFERRNACTETRFAAAAGHIEREPPLDVLAQPRLGQHREQVAHVRPDVRVGRRVAARSAANGGLVDFDDLVNLVDAGDRTTVRRRDAVLGDMVLERWHQHVVHQGRLARTRHASDRVEATERDLDVEALQVVVRRLLDLQGAEVLAAAGARHRHR